MTREEILEYIHSYIVSNRGRQISAGKLRTILEEMLNQPNIVGLAANIVYDNASSGLSAANVQGALDELAEMISGLLVPGSVPGSILIWNGTAWVENTSVNINELSKTLIFDTGDLFDSRLTETLNSLYVESKLIQPSDPGTEVQRLLSYAISSLTLSGSSGEVGYSENTKAGSLSTATNGGNISSRSQNITSIIDSVTDGAKTSANTIGAGTSDITVVDGIYTLSDTTAGGLRTVIARNTSNDNAVTTSWDTAILEYRTTASEIGTDRESFHQIVPEDGHTLSSQQGTSVSSLLVTPVKIQGTASNGTDTATLKIEYSGITVAADPSEKIGFFGSAPASQIAIADISVPVSDADNKINELLGILRTMGLIG